MIDIQPPPTFCEAERNFAYEVMSNVERANLSMIKAAYNAYTGDIDRSILIKANNNYASKNPLTPTEFSIEIFNECKGIHKEAK